jgi:hypothetical protein
MKELGEQEHEEHDGSRPYYSTKKLQKIYKALYVS